MSESNQSPTDADAENRTGKSLTLSRRKVLNSVAVSGALLGGMGVASASGQGGQAVVSEEDFKPDRSFVITEVSDCPEEATNPDGSCWAPTLYYQCKGEGGRAPPGKGGTLPFPYWTFQYYNDDGTLEDTERKLYTRDNEVRTGVTYHWPGRAKECPQESGEVLVQTGFSAGNGNG
jgi:hypothetical protein